MRVQDGDGFSLAHWLLSKEGSPPSSCRRRKVVSLAGKVSLLGSVADTFLLGSVLVVQRECERAPPSGLLTPFLKEVSLD